MVGWPVIRRCVSGRRQDVSHRVSHGRERCSLKAASPASLPSWKINERHLNCTHSSQDVQFVMFWRSGFSKQDIRVFLLRLRKGRLLLSQQDEGKQKQKQKLQQQKQPTMGNRRGVLDLGAESLLGSHPSNAKPALSQWAAKFNPAGQRFI